MAHASVFASEGCPPIFSPLGNEAGIEGIDLWRCYVPGRHELGKVPHISVCSISGNEINSRHEAGEDAGDLIHDYSTYVWFSDRAGYRVASRLARMIRKGGRLVGAVEPRVLCDCNIAFGEAVGLMVDLSPAHVTEG